MGCGSLLFTLPHFITDIYLKPTDQISTNLTQSNLCLQGSFFSKSILDKNANLDALNAANKLNQFKYIFIFGQILHGIGAAPLITLGVTLLGMISHKKSLIIIFEHKHKIKNFIKKFGIFHKKISTAFDCGLCME